MDDARENEIVIAGIAGRFPDSSNMNEFQQNLLNHVNLVTVDDRRFAPGVHGIPKGFGKIREIDKFDAEVFGMFPSQVRRTSPQLRIMLETVYEAILDAGVNPNEVRGSNTGVFVGISGDESATFWRKNVGLIEGHTIVGCNNSMFANRISFTFDFKGPSSAYDTACSSSLTALEAAVSAIREGKCDAAIVSGCSIILKPLIAMEFNKLGMLSPDSACKSFDKSGNGFARAESVVTIYIQKSILARRFYGSIVHIKTNTDGYKDKGITYPSGEMQTQLLQQVYQEAGVPVDQVTYVEAHGTGTQVGDAQELQALSNVFLTASRREALLVGSVKSNMGHGEVASGLCAIAKVLTFLQTGVIPANLHYKDPRDEFEFIQNGKLKIVQENTLWKGGLIGLSSFGFGGVNVHMIIKPVGNPKEVFTTGNQSLPRLTLFSGRTEKGVKTSLELVQATRGNQLSLLLNEINKTPSPALTVRAFCIQNSSNTEPCIKENEIDGHRPLWFVFNGMGSQWLGMAKDLLQIPLFMNSVLKLDRALKSYANFDLLGLLHAQGEPTIANPTNSFVGIVATQIGLVDLLSKLNIHPDGFLGHSVGEIGCAYIDKCLTAEQAIIAAYCRGKCLEGDDLSGAGAMAVVNLGLEELRQKCPKGIHIACHNGTDNITVSGLTDTINSFVAALKGEGIKVTLVNSCGIAFHSPYNETAARRFHKMLSDLIVEPSARSDRWMSTSVTTDFWSTTDSVSMPDYLTNNFKLPVLFHQALQHVPEDSIVVEIGPSGLLRGLIKHGCPSSTVVPLQSRSAGNGHVFLLEALGKLFLEGVNFDINKLQGNVNNFPVHGAPFISPLVSWNHSQKWDVPVYGKDGELEYGTFEVDLARREDSYLLGHKIQGSVIYPAAGYVFLAWRQFADIHQVPFESFPVVFENVVFKRKTVLEVDKKTILNVHVSEMSGAFEITESSSVVCSGRIRRYLNKDRHVLDEDDVLYDHLEDELKKELNEPLNMTSEEIYMKLRFIGLQYSGLFKGIERCNQNGTTFELLWTGNWISFIDTVVQADAFDETRNIVPAGFRKAVVRPEELLKYVQKKQTSEMANPTVTVRRYSDFGLVRCPGLEVRQLKTVPMSARRNEPFPILSRSCFIPYFDEKEDESETCSKSGLMDCLSVFLENIQSNRNTRNQVTIFDYAEGTQKDAIQVKKYVNSYFPSVDVNYTVVTSQNSDEALQNSGIKVRQYSGNAIKEQSDLILTDDIERVKEQMSFLESGSFVIVKDSYSDRKFTTDNGSTIPECVLVALKKYKNETTRLFKKVKDSQVSLSVIHVSSKELGWVKHLVEMIRSHEEMLSKGLEPSLVYLFSQCDESKDSGLLGLIRCIRRELCGNKFRTIVSTGKLDLNFKEPNNTILEKILEHDLAINVIDENGRWGFYRFLDITGDERKAKTDNAFLTIQNPGDLSSLNWVEGADLSSWSKFLLRDSTESVPVLVHYAALNFKDIMLASRNLTPEKHVIQQSFIESPLGFEFSGVTSCGRRVCGYNAGQSLATQVLAQEERLWEVPKDWSLEEAATVPVVYSTVYLALIIRGQIEEGNSILIHSGAGGVGLAAIRIAVSFNCNIFTTVGSKEKANFLRQQFPQIPESHIGNSRNTSFESMILNETNGRGVDLVLNSLSGTKLEASIRCLARHGRFLEIGKADLISNRQLGMELFLKDASFHGVMLDSLWDARPQLVKKLKDLVKSGIETDIVKPLPFNVFNYTEVEAAFRFMGSGKHVGKILIKMRDLDAEQKVPEIITERRVYFNPAKSYIVIGGLGGVGLQLVNWMVKRFARKLVVTSRSGLKSAYQQEFVTRWNQSGAQVEVFTLDGSRLEEAQSILNEAIKMGPVGGFFNLAAHLQLGLLKEQTEESFLACMEPKVQLTKNFDELTRCLCPQLDHFVVFSSIIAGFGIDGQTNYGFANSAAESICESRHSEGLPGKAIELGAISDAGMFYDKYNKELDKSSFSGSGLQNVTSLLTCLDTLLKVDYPIVSSRIEAELKGNEAGNKCSLSLIEKIGSIVGIDMSKVPPERKLVELGIDSIMSVEIGKFLQEDFGMTTEEILNSTIAQLVEREKASKSNTIVKDEGQERTALYTNLFHFNLLCKEKKSPIFFKQCVHPLNEVKDLSRGSVFICNSILGPEVLSLLGKMSTRPTYAMQFPEGTQLKSVRKITSTYLKELKAVQSEGPYIIGGFSAGTPVAMELALKLQELGEITKLVLIDSTHERIRRVIEESFGTVGEDGEIEPDEIVILSSLLTDGLNFDKAYLEKELSSLPDREAQSKKLFELANVLFEFPIEQDHVESFFVEIMIERMRAFRKYEPSGKFHGRAILVKANHKVIKFDSTEYWGLDDFCTELPTVVPIDATHSHMVTRPAVYRLAEIINAD